MGAEQRDPAQGSLSVCTAELLLLAHLLHHLDHPLHHHPPSLYHAPPYSPCSCLFIYLWFPSTTREPAGTQNKDGGYRGRNGWREGSKGVGGVNKGFVSGACRQHTCCLKRADIRAQQEAVDGEGMEGWTSFSSSHHFLSLCIPTDELDN